jgi:hypothetical protein
MSEFSGTAQFTPVSLSYPNITRVFTLPTPIRDDLRIELMCVHPPITWNQAAQPICLSNMRPYWKPQFDLANKKPANPVRLAGVRVNRS